MVLQDQIVYVTLGRARVCGNLAGCSTRKSHNKTTLKFVLLSKLYRLGRGDAMGLTSRSYGVIIRSYLYKLQTASRYYVIIIMLANL